MSDSPQSPLAYKRAQRWFSVLSLSQAEHSLGAQAGYQAEHSLLGEGEGRAPGDTEASRLTFGNLIVAEEEINCWRRHPHPQFSFFICRRLGSTVARLGASTKRTPPLFTQFPMLAFPLREDKGSHSTISKWALKCKFLRVCCPGESLST